MHSAWPGFRPGTGMTFPGGLLVRGHLRSQTLEVMDPGRRRDNRSRFFIPPEEPSFASELQDSRGRG